MSRLKFRAGYVAALLLMLMLSFSMCRPKRRILQSPPGFDFSKIMTNKLPKEMLEISGVVWDPKNDVFIAHNDEMGSIFYLDKETKLVKSVVSFAGRGDYEDIALYNGTPYVLESSGQLTRIVKDDNGKTYGLDMGKISLSGTNDFESLYYDASRNALILLCKNCELDDDNSVSAFAYYPDSIGFDTKPVYTINAAQVRKLSPQKTEKLQPSAAAINPLTKKLFIVSSLSHQLVIADPANGNVEGVYILSKKIFPQPEGITFKQKEGEMYITNEGIGTREATMLKFERYDTLRNKKAMTKQGYDFTAPDDKMELGEKLHEISGMAYIPGEDVILAENDEKGAIFTVSFTNKTIEPSKLRFGGKGDYEDIVHTDSAEYMLVSPGSVVEVKRLTDTTISTQEFSLGLDGFNEFETMYLDSTGKGLILLCKECNHEKNKYRDAYRYDLTTKTFSPQPVFRVDIGQISNILNEDKADFKPSAGAINPVTGQLFLIASVGKILVIADQKGKIEQVIRLDPKMFNQPEGMTFAPNGDLYISNEGGEGIATILKFSYKKK